MPIYRDSIICCREGRTSQRFFVNLKHKIYILPVFLPWCMKKHEASLDFISIKRERAEDQDEEERSLLSILSIGVESKVYSRAFKWAIRIPLSSSNSTENPSHLSIAQFRYY